MPRRVPVNRQLASAANCTSICARRSALPVARVPLVCIQVVPAIEPGQVRAAELRHGEHAAASISTVTQPHCGAAPSWRRLPVNAVGGPGLG